MTRFDVDALTYEEAAHLDPKAVAVASILRYGFLFHISIFNLILRQLQGPDPFTGRVRLSGTTAAMRHVRGLAAILRGRILGPENPSGRCNITL